MDPGYFLQKSYFVEKTGLEAKTRNKSKNWNRSIINEEEQITGTKIWMKTGMEQVEGWHQVKNRIQEQALDSKYLLDPAVIIWVESCAEPGIKTGNAGACESRVLQCQRRICKFSSESFDRKKISSESVDRKPAPTHHLSSRSSSRMEAIKKKMQAMKVEEGFFQDLRIWGYFVIKIGGEQF